MSQEQTYERRRLSVGPSPHISTRETATTIMMDVLIALVPTLCAAVYFFGPRALMLAVVTVAATVGSEALYRFGTKQSRTVGDLSAAVTGLLLALSLPVQTPYWVAVIGGCFAIVIVKQLFGGLGKNFMNPALAGRVFLFSFAKLLGQFAAPHTSTPLSLLGGADAVSAATPMASLHQGVIPPDISLRQLMVGEQAGSMGEVASIMLILGGLYLVLRRVIRLRVPLFYIGTVAVLTYLFPLGGNDPKSWMLYQLLSGGLLLGAIFMATDYVTSPVTPWGQRIYAIGCGALTVFLRYFGSYPEGVSFAILVMNLTVWALDKLCAPHRYGVPYFKKKEKEGGPS